MKRIYCVLYALFLLWLSQMEAQQTIEGVYSGSMEAQGTEIELIFEFIYDSTDNLQKCLLSVPKQGLRAHAADQVITTDTNFTVVFNLFSAYYIGEFDAEDEINGIWKQGGFSVDLQLKRNENPAVMHRPQEPQSPFPYEISEYEIKNEDSPDVVLKGTLTNPKGDGPYPLAILISGSGPQNRNEELLGHKPFWVIADYLTKHGIAVFRYDDRGIGESTGNFQSATSLDFASDSRSIAEYFRGQDLPISKIGLIGHSEGGLIAPMVANTTDAVDFVVLLAGPGIRGKEILLAQAKLIFSKSGMEAEELNRQVKYSEAVYDLIISTPETEELDYEKLKELSREFYDKAGEGLKTQFDTYERFYFSQSSVLSSPWMRYFIAHDPQPDLKKLKIPVLALNGSLDLQVPSKENLEAIQRALEEAPTQKFKVKEYPGLNHLFQDAETGLPNEYSEIEETFNESVLQQITSWILSLL